MKGAQGRGGSLASGCWKFLRCKGGHADLTWELFLGFAGLLCKNINFFKSFIESKVRERFQVKKYQLKEKLYYNLMNLYLFAFYIKYTVIK